MKITCQACGAKYTIADDKVRGRKVKIRCKGCSAPIVVDAQQPGAESADAGTDASEALEAAPQSVPPAAPALDAWSVNLSDTDQRTMTTEEIVAGYKSGLVTTDAFVWKEGMGDWVALLDSAELKPLLGAPAVAAAPFVAPAVAASPQPAAVGAKRAGGRDAGAVDLFGSVQTAGSEEEEVATSAPQFQGGALPAAGSTAYGDDDKLMGQRNENSVLFSLDALKAGVSDAPKPAAVMKKGAPPPRKGSGPATAQQPSDPFGMGGGANDLMNLGGGGNPLFSMNSNQALLTAPAAPEPPPARSTDLGLSGPMSVSSPTQKKGKGLIIGAVIAVVGLIVIGAVAMSGGDKSAETAPSATAETAAAATTEAPKPEEKKEEPKPEEKKPEAAASATASAAPTAAAATETKPTGPTPGTVPGTTKPKEKEKEEAAPAPTAGPFSISAAQAALGSAAGSAGGCKKPGGPTGSGKVQVTFAPSGRVTSANVAGPPFAGTPVGGCVAGMFRRAKVPPFSGNPVTVSKSFSVN
jgi:predicted Zn finger-like uncharacterized protein